MRKSTSTRRDILKATVWAAPATVGVCMTGLPLLAGCSPKGAPSAESDIGVRAGVAQIAKGELKAEAFAADLLKRAADHRDLNAFVTLDSDKVLAAARAVDQARTRGDKLGPLAGLPLAIKDQIDVAGYPTSAGNGALKQAYTPKRNAAIVDILTNAGAIVFGKTLCPDMVGSGGLNPSSATTDNRWFGSAHNPYDLLHTPGGSSGGNGAAVAARVVPAAIGEDTGGSVRIPSAFCGTAGLRPSTFTVENLGGDPMSPHKRYPDAGIVPPPGLLETFGPMARSVADVAFLDAVISGEPTPPAPEMHTVRIGIPRDDYWEIDAMDPAVTAVTKAAFAKLRDAGATLVEIDLRALMALNENGRLAAGPPRQSLADWLAENAPGVTLEQIFANRIVPVGMISPPTPHTPEDLKQIFAASLQAYQDIFKSNNLAAVAFPTCPFTAPFINLNGDTANQKIRVNGHWVDEIGGLITHAFAAPRFGAPGLSLPSGLAAGLPVGLELDGLPGDDAKILALGMAVEKVLGPLPAPTYSTRLAPV